MYDPAAKTGLAGEMLGQVDRIVVARKFGEPDHVFILDRLANRRPHADRKIIETERLKEIIRQAASETFNRRELMEIASTGRPPAGEPQLSPASRPFTAEAPGSRRSAT